jgi:hypothetical protein
MSTTAVGHCSRCDAVVNICWPRCLVCQAPLLAPSRKTGSPTSALALTQAQGARPLAPGSRITWKGSDCKAHVGVVDFLQTYPGEVWAFCTLIDGGWTAVNVKYIDGEGHSKTDAQGTAR